MPIGKSSIEKRVAKTEPEKKNQAPELVATTAAAPAKKAPAKKSSAAKATPKAPAAKKPAAKKPATPKAPKAAPAEVNTGVLTNVAPETVEKVIGRKEKEACEIVQVGQKLPSHLL